MKKFLYSILVASQILTTSMAISYSDGMGIQDIRLKTPSCGILKNTTSAGVLNDTGSDSVSLVSHWYDGISQGNISNAAAWQEISGIATPKLAANSNYLWTVADSPSNQFAAMGVDGSPQGVLTLTSSTAKVDVEKVTSFNISGVNYLYFMDMGNNSNTADSRGSGIDLRIFRVVEPTITGSNIATADFIEINCAFPSGHPPTLRDTEAAFVAMDLDGTVKLFIITKRNLDQNVYSLPHATSYVGTQELTYEGDMTALPESRTAPLTTTPCYAVSACARDDGREILVKNYNNVYVFTRDPNTQTVFEALSGVLVDVPAYVGGGTLPIATSHPSQEPQGEAMCYSFNQSDFFTCSEYRDTDGGSTSTRFPLFKYQRCPSVPITVSFQDGVSPTVGYAATLDTTIWDTNPDTTTYGTVDASVVADKAVGVESDQRKALIQWDLTAGSIPATATIVGAKIDLYITAEGQGWTIHQMLVPWTESSTYNTLTTGVAPDDVEAGIPEQCRNGVNLNGVQTISSRNNIYTQSYYLFPMAQYWVSGLGNYGVIIIATDIAGGDGQQFASSEATTASQRPKLTLRYIT